ncbi:hypothetical protein, partial [Gordonia humi]
TLARRLVPASGTAGAVAAAVVGIWNPFVAERLLQGHWSLLIGYATLGPIVLTVLGLAEERSWRRIAMLTGLFAAAGFTPTGSILALVVAAVTAVAARPGVRMTLIGAVGWVLASSPWLVAAAVSNASGSSGGAAAFALRAEPGLGSFGTALGLGGIWNADAVPTSRTTWWAAVATALFLLVVATGTIALLRSSAGPVPKAECGADRRDEPRVETAPARRLPLALALLALAAVLLVVLAATGPGRTAMDAVLADVPGAGLLRDTQKYVALAVPFASLAAAAAVGALRRLVPGGFAATAVALLVAALLPDLAWGVGGQIRPVTIPADYQRVVDEIGDGDGSSVALWPTSTVRSLSWTDGPSLSPLPRMIDAPVVVDGTLIVDGEPLDAPTGRTADIVAALNDGGDPQRLAALGVGWVVVDEADPPPLLADSQVTGGDRLRLYRIADAEAAPSPSAAAWISAIGALALWCTGIVCGVAAAIYRRRPDNSSNSSANPSAVDAQE